MKKPKRLIAPLLAAMMLAGCVSVSDTDETDVSESTSAEQEPGSQPAVPPWKLM